MTMPQEPKIFSTAGSEGGLAAGAQLIIAQLSLQSPLYASAVEYLETLGCVREDYAHDDPQAELDGLEGLLAHLRRHCPKLRIGNALRLRTDLWKRIHEQAGTS